MNNNDELDQLAENDAYAPDYVVNAFTKTGNEVNLEVDNLNIKCLTSKNSKFSLDEEGNLVVNSITCNKSPNKINSLLDVYPVGSIYMNFTSVNPSTLFGGEWKQLKGRFLIGQGKCEANTTDWFGNCEEGFTDMLEAELGGEVNHALTIAEMPAHNHEIVYYNSAWSNTVPKSENLVSYGGYSTAHARSAVQNNSSVWTGGNQAHNNMPPYIVVYIWQRIS